MRSSPGVLLRLGASHVHRGWHERGWTRLEKAAYVCERLAGNLTRSGFQPKDGTNNEVQQDLRCTTRVQVECRTYRATSLEI
jgi:hypothetical protein